MQGNESWSFGSAITSVSYLWPDDAAAYVFSLAYFACDLHVRNVRIAYPPFKLDSQVWRKSQALFVVWENIFGLMASWIVFFPFPHAEISCCFLLIVWESDMVIRFNTKPCLLLKKWPNISGVKEMAEKQGCGHLSPHERNFLLYSKYWLFISLNLFPF